jgi:hypothetical protein
MPQADTRIFEAIGAAGPTRADAVARIQALAHVMDSAFTIPGTSVRVGLDAVLGLIPGVGDAVSAALSSYIVWEARRLGLPRWKIARMVANVAVDAAVGVVPLVGDLFDVAFKANRRNLRIVLDHLERQGEPIPRAPGPRGPRVIEGEAVRVGERPLHGESRR